jgi:histidine decarboxylase
MKTIFSNFSKREIIKSAISPYDNYCTGYPGKGNYLVALVLGFGTTRKTFSHAGSDILDKIVAFDKAETSGAYLGQINMSIVSSFCGIEGLIWGYDLAKKEDIAPPYFLPTFYENIQELKDIKIKNGENLRKAAMSLFGTNKEKHFPFLPGSHVPCAGRFYDRPGPTILYGAVAIGIPMNRETEACLLMEDVGEITALKGTIEPIKEKLMLNVIESVIKVGENQKIKYQEIFVDFIMGEVKTDEMGCVLVAMPYFLLAKNAFNENLINQDLRRWEEDNRKYFLCNQKF